MTTTPTEHLKTITHEFFRVWNGGDLSVIDEHFADDYVAHDASVPGGLHGPEGYKTWVEMYRNAFPDLESRIADIVAEGDTVAVRYSHRGTQEGEFLGVEPTGGVLEGTGMSFIRFEDGKVKEEWYADDSLILLQKLAENESESPG